MVYGEAKTSLENFIEVKNVSFAYDEENHPEKKAVDNVSFEVKKGEMLAVVGHNGSGKSTLAKLLNGLLQPTEGDVFVMGKNTMDDESIIDVRNNVAMVFQNPDNQLVATMVEDEVAFGAENLGMDPEEIRMRIDESLAAVGMAEFKNKKTNQLSGGQKQRVAIAGVLAMKPKCIVFDESTAMLDPAGREDVLNIMHKLNSEGVSVVFITHYMEEITDFDRIIVMSKGKIAKEGTPSEIFSSVEELHKFRLDAPEIVWLSELLRRGGLGLPKNILSAEELVEALCQLK